jgi:hypothetical protein
MIPIASQVTVTLEGAVTKLVQCENCRCEYLYKMARRVKGSGTNVLFLDGAGARDRATSEAEKRLQRALEFGCDPVPCPDCGWYQAKMVPLVRRAYHRWMFILGVACFVIAGFSGAGLWLSSINTRVPPEKETLQTLQAITFFAALGGTALVVTRKLLSLVFDPNGLDQEERKHLGESRAVRRADLEKSREPAP